MLTARQTVSLRRQRGDWTEEEILIFARRAVFYVHLYRYNKTGLRKRTRRMCKEGKLTLVGRFGDELGYRAISPSKENDATN